jgi:uncharacterized surface protein with fasciclin (FAS1) repeats
MKSTKTFGSIIAGLFSLVVITTTSCKKDDPAPVVTPTVVGIAQSDTSFSILVEAVLKADLAGTLSDLTKSYTVFAPTNNAFRAANITSARIASYTESEVNNVLKPILLYHVLGAKVLAAGVPVSDGVATLNTKKVFASRNANGVFVNGVKVATADLQGSNGVVHVIGSVLIPPTQSIAQVVSTNPDFSLLLQTVQKANLATTLGGDGKFTVFAPDNTAFATSSVNSAAIAGFTEAAAAGIITQHAFGTNIFASDLTAGVTGATLNTAKTLTVALSPVSVILTGSANPASAVKAANIVCTNGVIHVIDRVLL